MRALWLAHERFLFELGAEGGVLDGVFYSYSHPDGVAAHFSGASLERKPSPYNLFVAAAQFDLDLPASWMIGDRETDVECGRAAQTRTILISAKQTPPSAANWVAPSISDAAELICRETQPRR